ncbi:SPATA22 (predicted) [Pycnogonum litorale]
MNGRAVSASKTPESNMNRIFKQNDTRQWNNDTDSRHWQGNQVCDSNSFRFSGPSKFVATRQDQSLDSQEQMKGRWNVQNANRLSSLQTFNKGTSNRATVQHGGDNSNDPTAKTPTWNFKKTANERNQTLQVREFDGSVSGKKISETFTYRQKTNVTSMKIFTSVVPNKQSLVEHKNKSGVFVYEIYGIIGSAVSVKQMKNVKFSEFMLRGSTGECIKCQFYEIDRQLCRLTRGQWHRCVGNIGGDGQLMCVSVRPASKDEMANLDAMVSLSSYVTNEA